MITVKDVMLARGFTLNSPGDTYEHGCGVAVTVYMVARIFADRGADALSYYLHGIIDGYHNHQPKET